MDDQETSAQRLNQIEILLATAAKAINRNTENIDRLTERMDRSEERMDRTEERMDRTDARFAEISEMFIESVGIIRQHQVNIEKMQSEIRGLQVENQRIILRVLGGDEYLDT
jgi:uncharacterized coiled-coil DUF342 family protein